MFYPLAYKYIKTPINPSKLGVICPDGKVVFQSEETAMQFAKNRVMQALHCEKPYERAVIVSDNVIVKEYEGTTLRCGIDRNLNVPSKATLVHGHPANGVISSDDYMVLMTRNWLKDIVAINKKGEYSKLTKHNVPWFVYVISPEYLSEYMKSFLANANDMLKSNFKQMFFKVEDAMKKINPDNFKGKSKEEMLLNDVIKQFKDLLIEANKKIHKFWQQKAKHLCVDYETNYSYLNED